MGYFAFVRRDAARRYHATLPDFPGVEASAERIGALPDAVRAAIARHLGGRPPPPPTRLESLPRVTGDADGYWLLVEPAPARR